MYLAARDVYSGTTSDDYVQAYGTGMILYSGSKLQNAPGIWKNCSPVFLGTCYMILSGLVYLCPTRSFLTPRTDIFMVSAILKVVSSFCFCNMIHLTLGSSNFFITRIFWLFICRHSLACLDLTRTHVFLLRDWCGLSVVLLYWTKRTNDFLYKMPHKIEWKIKKA